MFFEIPDMQPCDWVALTVLVVECLATLMAQHFRHCGSKVAVKFLTPLGVSWLASGVFFCLMYYPEISLAAMSGWHLAFVALVGLQLVQFSFIVPKLNKKLGAMQAIWKLAYFTILIGLTEEMWFRGIWFEICGNDFFLSVVIGSVLFGLLHWTQDGFLAFVGCSLVGVVLAVARYNGASILSLAIAHGLTDFINISVIPAERLRFSRTKTVLIATPAFLALATIIHFFPI